MKKIIAIDPGITNCGVTVQELRDTLHILRINNVAGHLKLRDRLALIGQQLGERSGKVIRICGAVEEYLKEFPEIKDIVIEAPFFNRFRPNAFASLLEILHALKYTVIMERDVNLHVVEPKLVKKYFHGSGNAGKDHMEEAFHRRFKAKEITFENEEDLEKMTEHLIDAVAVGWTYKNKE